MAKIQLNENGCVFFIDAPFGKQDGDHYLTINACLEILGGEIESLTESASIDGCLDRKENGGTRRSGEEWFELLKDWLRTAKPGDMIDGWWDIRGVYAIDINAREVHKKAFFPIWDGPGFFDADLGIIKTCDTEGIIEELQRRSEVYHNPQAELLSLRERLRRIRIGTAEGEGL